MDMSRYEQFLLESKLIEESTNFATDHAMQLDNKYKRMTEEELMYEGPQLLLEMEYWEGRLRTEERILSEHVKKYREFILDEEI